MKIRLIPGTTYVSKNGETHEPGSVVDVPDAEGEALIRTGSAASVDHDDRLTEKFPVNPKMFDHPPAVPIEETQHGGN